MIPFRQLSGEITVCLGEKSRWKYRSDAPSRMKISFRVVSTSSTSPTFAYLFHQSKLFCHMKKTVLGMLAGAALMFSLASCGEKLLTDEQVQAEITKGFDAGKAAVESEMNAKCDADFETRVTAELDNMKAQFQSAGNGATVPPGASR